MNLDYKNGVIMYLAFR